MTQEEKIKYYFLPYQAHLKITQIGEYQDDAPMIPDTPQPEQTAWAAFDETCSYTLPQKNVPNASMTRSFIKNDCPPNYVPVGSVPYTVAAGSYMGYNLNEANLYALQDIYENGQDYANANGTCELMLDVLLMTTTSSDSSFTFSLNTGSQVIRVEAKDSSGQLLSFVSNGSTTKTLNLSAATGLKTIRVIGDPSLVQSLLASNKNINDVYIENFPSIQNINVSQNLIQTINLSNSNDITQLDVSDNLLSSLNVSNLLSLTNLNASDNTITSINLNNNVSLQYLEIDNNNLSVLSVINNSNLLWCLASNNNLNSIDLGSNNSISWLRIFNNNLSSLITTGLPNLQTIEAYNNNITSLDLSNNSNIITLNIGLNPISSLTVNNLSQLTTLFVSGCNLTAIDLSTNTNLTAIQIAENNLTTLDIFHLPNLQSLDCTRNLNLGGFNVSNNNLLTDLRCGECDFTSTTGNPTVIDAVIIQMDSNITSGGVLHYDTVVPTGIQPTSASLAAYNSLVSKGCDLQGKIPA